MAFVSKQSAIAYIDSGRLFFYAPVLKNTIQQNFAPDTVADLDIHNRDKFEIVLDEFIQKNLKGMKFDVTLVFSTDITFEKELVPVLNKDHDEQVMEFINLVPFEEVLSKTFKFSKNEKVVAVNKAFYDSIRDVFVKNKLTMSLVLPLSVILERYPELSNRMELSSILSKVDSLKQYNLLDFTPSFMGNQKVAEDPKKIKHIRLYAGL